MYTVSVETTFFAIHGLQLRDGTMEPRHGHEWRACAHFARADLDEDGMVIDFAEARAALDSATEELRQTDLNVHPGLRGRNPTAENLARHIFERLRDLGQPSVTRVQITEALGCVATYEPPLCDPGIQNAPII